MFLAKPLMVTAETISSRSIGIGGFPPNPQADRLHYKCNLTNESSDFVQMLSLNDTRNNSPYSVVKDLSPYNNYTVTCWVLKDGVDQCYIGSDTTQTYTDSMLLQHFLTHRMQRMHMFYRPFLTMPLSLPQQDPVLHLKMSP